MCLKKRYQCSNKAGTEKSLLKLFHFISNKEEAFVYECGKININYPFDNPTIQSILQSSILLLFSKLLKFNRSFSWLNRLSNSKVC